MIYKNTAKIATETKRIKCNDTATWIDLYFCISNDTAYTTPGEGRYLVTRLINPQTARDISNAINRWLNM